MRWTKKKADKMLKANLAVLGRIADSTALDGLIQQGIMLWFISFRRHLLEFDLGDWQIENEMDETINAFEGAWQDKNPDGLAKFLRCYDAYRMDQAEEGAEHQPKGKPKLRAILPDEAQGP